MTNSNDAHPPKQPLSHRSPAGTAVGGPRWKRLLERQRLSNEAMAVARPFNAIVTALKVQIDELRATLERDDDTTTPTGLSDAAHVLDRFVYGQQLAFADATRMLACSIAENDRISDTRNALNSAAAAIDVIRTTLGKQRHVSPVGR